MGADVRQPQILNQTNQVFPNFKFTCLSVQIDPKNELKAHDDFSDVLKGLKTNPVSKTELDRVCEPIKNRMNDRVHDNGYLAYALASAYSNLDRLSEHSQGPRILKRLKLRTIQRKIETQFDPDKNHIFRTVEYRNAGAISRKTLEIKSHLGDVDAQLTLGKMLIHQFDAEERAVGIEVLEKAAAQGSSPAQIELAKHYIYKEENLEKAAEYLEPAAGTKEGAYLLGSLYFNNFTTFPDISDERIIALLTFSAQQRSADAQYMLAERLKDGTLVERDETGALKWALISNYVRRGVANIIDDKSQRRFVEGLTKAELEKAQADAEAWIKKNPFY